MKRPNARTTETSSALRLEQPLLLTRLTAFVVACVIVVAGFSSATAFQNTGSPLVVPGDAQTTAPSNIFGEPPPLISDAHVDVAPDDSTEPLVIVDDNSQLSANNPPATASDTLGLQPTAEQAVPFANAQPFWFGYSTPVRVNVYGGESYAEPSAFVSLDIMKPLHNWRFSNGSEQIQYLDARVGVSFESGALMNLGIGRRHYFAERDLIVDGTIWYDIDGTRDRVFHQVTAGAQVQGRRLLVRGQYYFPFADTKAATGYTDLTGNVAYQGNILALERFRNEQQAYQGFDTAVGVTLPTQNLAQLLVGYYHFQADDAPQISGVSATLTAEVMPALLLSLTANFDDQSDNTLLVTGTYDFYSGRKPVDNTIRHRMGEPVARNRHIVSRGTQVYDPLAATYADGSPINIIHVSSAGTSTGTFESPYANLSEGATDAAATDNSIILVHADSVFDGQSVVLPGDTRLLGETFDHLVTTTELGDVILPRATAGTSAAIIRNTAAVTPVITLADNSEVNGLRIENAGGTGIFGDGLAGGTTVSNMTIDGAATGLLVQNSSGTTTFDSIDVSNTTGSGIALIGNAGVFNFTSTSVSNTAGTGIQLSGNGGTVALTTTNISNAAGKGVHVQNSTGTTAFDGLTVSGTGAQGIHLQDSTASATTTFANTTSINNAGTHGLHVEGSATSSAITFDGPLSINNSGSNGILLNGNSDESSVTFNGATTIDSTGGNGLSISNLDFVTNPFGHDVQFTSNLSINNTGLSGIATTGNGTNLSIQTLAITDWGQSAIAVDGGTGNLTVVDPLVLNNVNGALNSTILLTNTNSSDMTFGDVTITDTARTLLGAPVVNLDDNDTSVFEITFNSLNINSINGTALSASQSAGRNTKLEIGGGVISSVNASAISLTQTDTAVTLQSVSAQNAAIGISLQEVGATAFHEYFRITGTGTTTGSGGVMTGVQRGIVATGSDDVSFNLMNIDSSVVGVQFDSIGFNEPRDVSATGLQLTDAGGSANWVGVDVSWDRAGAHGSGANVYSNNTITGSGTSQTGIRIVNVESNPGMPVTIGGNTINLTGGSSNGISLSATGLAVGQINPLGDINLTTSLNNIVSATSSPFIATTSTGAEITGQILVNGFLVP